MPRANRYIVPGFCYHITHRCHNKAFLLRFARDRQHYRERLREVLRDQDIGLLQFTITSNHVHLLLAPSDSTTRVSRLMQLVQGQHAQAYNRRRNRHGAFWEDRYHATMIEEGVHLWRCLAYIDLNMVRTGVVEHPREWEWTGYNERMRGQMSHRQTLETDPFEPNGDLWALREAHSPYRLNSGRKTASKRQTSH